MRTDVTETLHGTLAPHAEPAVEQSLAQINRLIRSHLLQGSETLCKLLQYLARHTLNAPSDHLKEYQIATEVLGRGPDFDPQSDASVRVQVGRLRSKLSEYYNSVGKHDPILVDIPKGRYLLTFAYRPSAIPEKPHPELAPVVSLPQPDRPFSVRRNVVIWTVIAATLGFGVGAFIRTHAPAQGLRVSDNGASTPPESLRVFWHTFLSGPEEPYVVFSNAAFVGDAESGMRYFDQSRDARNPITQHYTGIGEVMGVLKLDRLFRLFGQQFRIKRVGLFTLDDALHNNLIFVGSPTENLTLRELPSTGDFVFQKVPDGANRWNEVIVDHRPGRGEPSVYRPTPHGRPLEEDFAVVALSRGLDPSRWTLMLAGTSTIGTEAAVDYVCDPGSIQELINRLKVDKTSGLRPFQALLRINVANDVPIGTHLLILRPADPKH